MSSIRWPQGPEVVNINLHRGHKFAMQSSVIAGYLCVFKTIVESYPICSFGSNVDDFMEIQYRTIVVQVLQY